MLTALVAIGLLLSGGYRRIERITTFLVATVTFITVACVAMLPAMGYPVGWADLRHGFSLEVLTLPGAAVAAAFGTFGITGVGAASSTPIPTGASRRGTRGLPVLAPWGPNGPSEPAGGCALCTWMLG